MHEQLNGASGLKWKPTTTHTFAVNRLKGAPQTAQNWLRRRLFRTVHIGVFVSGMALVGALHCQHVIAQQKLTQEASALTVVGSKPAAATDAKTAATSAAVSTETVAPGVTVETVTKPAQLSAKPQVYQVDEKRDQIIPFTKVIHLSQSEPLGHTRVAIAGSNGLLEKTYTVTYIGNTPQSFVLRGQKIVKKPVDMVVVAGYTDREARALPSRSGMYTRSREIDMIATGYSPYEGSGSGRCATGCRAGLGVVAVNPHFIPLGSKLYIEGYGYALAGDTGGAIRGRRVDLGLNTYRAANRIGRKTVHVYVLSEAR